MNEQIPDKPMKRRVAFKLKIGDIFSGEQVMDGERFGHLKLNGKEIIRVNLIANVVDKYLQEGEKKYGSITLDDGSGQVRVKFFGEDVEKMSELNQGDTILFVGLLRVWNNEIYLTSEIMKKKDPKFLLIRKLELEAEQPKELGKEEMAEMKDKILKMVKDAEEVGGIDIEKIITELKESPDIINAEIKRLLEDGVAYEPRPGKLRYLG